MQKEKTSSKAWILRCIVPCIAAAILLPLLVDYLILRLFPSSSLQASDWLTFWGSYLGGLLGSVAALIALFMTMKQADQQLFMTMKQADQHQEETKEHNRLSVIPALNLTFMDFPKHVNYDKFEACILFYPDEEKSLYEVIPGYFKREYRRLSRRNQPETCIKQIINIKNCGMGPCMNVSLNHNGCSVPIGSFKDGHCASVAILLGCSEPENEEPKLCTFQITITDIFGNQYQQEQTIKSSIADYTFLPTTLPKLTCENKT